MLEKPEIMRMASAMAAHAGNRQVSISRNIANADTPSYKAVDIASFPETYEDRPGFVPRATRAEHFGFRQMEAQVTPVAMPQVGAESPNGNTVSLEGEMMKAVEVRQQHEMALAIYKSATTILRGSLGRR